MVIGLFQFVISLDLLPPWSYKQCLLIPGRRVTPGFRFVGLQAGFHGNLEAFKMCRLGTDSVENMDGMEPFRTGIG